MRNAAIHYDAVTDGWSHIFGDCFHFGLFPDDPTLPLNRATANLVHSLAHPAELTPGMTILDIGCGIGAPAEQLVRSFDVSVHGISTSKVGIERAKTRASKSGLGERLIFSEADGAATDLPDGHFDCVWIMEASHLFADKSRLFHEAYRLLRPGGRLALCDITTARLLPVQRSLANARKFRAVDLAFGSCHTESSEYYRMMADDSGFQRVTVSDISQEVHPTLNAWRHNLSSKSEAIAATMGDLGVQRFLRAVDVLDEFFASGVLGYILLWAKKPPI